MTLRVTQPSPDPTHPAPPEPILPPRPNLGPEPWHDATAGNGWGLVIAVLVLLLALCLGVWMRSRGMRRRTLDPRQSGSGPNSFPPFSSPDEGRILRAERLREALISAFGPSWRAKTTEEIAADPALLTRLGPERSAQVVVILSEADRAKFAGPSPEDHRPSEEDDRSLADVISTLTSSPTGTGR